MARVSGYRPPSWSERWLRRMEQGSPRLLATLLLLFTVVFWLVALQRLTRFRQGFDLVSYVQPIWNMSQGRPFEQSIYAGTGTILGVDLFWIEGLLAVPYLLLPGYGTLFVVLAASVAAGGLGIYLLAQEALDSRLAGLLAAAVYLGNLTIQSVTPYELRPRLIAATALIFAYFFQRQQRPLAFWLSLLLALSVRLDVALAVAMLGLVGWRERRRWTFSWLPLAVALAYFVLGMFVIVPALRGGGSFLFLFYFAWLGETPGAILTTLVTRPDLVLQHVVTVEKVRYLGLLLWPVAGLALLRPLLLLPALPSLAINLLAADRTLIRIDYDYSVLVVLWLVVAAVFAVSDIVARRGPAWSSWRRVQAYWAARRQPPPPRVRAYRGARATPEAPTAPSAAPLSVWVTLGAVALLLVATASQHVVATLNRGAVGAPSPLVEELRQAGSEPRRAAARRVLAAVPPDGPLAVSSELAPHVPLRRELYFFPGNRAYAAELIDRARWVLADRRRSAAERLAIERMLGGGAWRTLIESEDYVLMERLR